MRRTPVLLTTLVLLVAAVGPAAAAGPAAGGPGPARAADGAATDRSTDGAADGAGEGSPTTIHVGATTGAATSEHDACEPYVEDPRPNPETDQLGWETGCWANATLQIDRSDGLNETELAAVVGRAMARVERIRQLEFNQTVPVETMTREQYSERVGSAYGSVSEQYALHQDVKWEATFMVPEDRSAIAELRGNRAGNVLGFYSPASDRIVIITEGGSAEISEYTLAHELVHALQDQQFGLAGYNRSTTEQNNAVSGIVEGDANYVEALYTQRCTEGWQCPPQGGGASAPPGFNFGLYFVSYHPYSDGPVLVAHLREEGGWAAVNAAYDDPPASTEQVIHPDRYDEDPPTNVTVADRSSGEWHVLQLEGGVNYATFGEAGIFSMLYYPAFQTRGEESVVAYGHLFQYDDDIPSFDSYDYDHRYSAGWDGDKLYPYVRNDSARTNETGYVWKTVWDSEADARQFAAGYVRLLGVRGAEPVEGYRNTFRIPDGQEYGDAFYINRTGTTVVIVNAPTAEALSEVRAGAAPEVEPTPTPSPTPAMTPTPTPTPTPTASTTPAGGEETPTPTADPSPEPTETTSPGLGIQAAVIALVVLAVLARRRQ